MATFIFGKQREEPQIRKQRKQKLNRKPTLKIRAAKKKNYIC